MRVSATRKRENGGRPRRAFRAANDADRMAKGATILKTYIELNFHRDDTKKHPYQKRCHKERSECWDEPVNWFEIERARVFLMSGSKSKRPKNLRNGCDAKSKS